MSLLQLDHVGKRYRYGARELEVLRAVSLEIDERELIAIWGPRDSGRSTLLRIAGGIEAPDTGQVWFRGRAMRVGGTEMPGGIAYCQSTFRSLEGQRVLEELIAAQLALGIRASGARARASETLERVGARTCEARRPCELDRSEAVRVSLARALLQEPALLVVDEPTTRVEPLERDRVLELLRSLSDDGIAVLMAVDRGASLFAADRALSLADGMLRGHVAPELAPIVELPLRLSG
ncbi:MAG: ATP-binding cassette domain-containing protein [Solirubrobacterales bacterium]|nr:ATP-binding cassette domain-containing protein [Solirubrobacterales bacterium]